MSDYFNSLGSDVAGCDSSVGEVCAKGLIV